MKRLLALLLLAIPCAASGPKYVGSQTDPQIFMEFQNVYQDIGSLLKGDVRISSVTISTLTLTGYLRGDVVQILSATQTTQTTTTSSTFQSTSLTKAITPSSATSKIAIFATGTVGVNGTASDVAVYASIFNGTTDLGNGNGMISRDEGSITLADNNIPAAMFWVDSPASTSAQTYTVKIRNNDNASTVRWNNSGGTASLWLLEIKQ